MRPKRDVTVRGRGARAPGEEQAAGGGGRCCCPRRTQGISLSLRHLPSHHHTPHFKPPTHTTHTMSFCSGCIDLKELPGAPAGKTQQIAGLDAYVAQGSKKGTIVRVPVKRARGSG